MKFGQNILPVNRVSALSHAVLLRTLSDLIYEERV